MKEIVESAFDKALENLGLNGIDSLSEKDKVVASVFALEAEVNNGGFDQFFLILLEILPFMYLRL